jgi:subtilisin family serine protease
MQALPLDQQYTFGSMDSAGTGRGVTIYTLDSGVRIAHEEFRDWANRMPRVSYGCGEWLHTAYRVPAPSSSRAVVSSQAQPDASHSAIGGLLVRMLINFLLAGTTSLMAWTLRPTATVMAPLCRGADVIQICCVCITVDPTSCHKATALVRSIAIGRNVGVAKEAAVVALRVLDCQGAGSVSNVVAGATAAACRTAAACCVVSTEQTRHMCNCTKVACLSVRCSKNHGRAAATAALDWVVRNATKPAIATLSLGIPVGSWSRALEAAARRVLAAGILVVVAAGACPMLAHRNWVYCNCLSNSCSMLQ